MRKILLYLVVFVLICFFLPVIFTPKSKNVAKTIENIGQNTNQNTTENTQSTYD